MPNRRLPTAMSATPSQLRQRQRIRRVRHPRSLRVVRFAATTALLARPSSRYRVRGVAATEDRPERDREPSQPQTPRASKIQLLKLPYIHMRPEPFSKAVI